MRIVPILLLILVGACAPGRAADNSGRLTVVAGFYPLAYAAERVGGGLVDVHNLTPPGVEPHDLELTPNEIAEIDQADVVLYLGRGFGPAVEDAVADAEGLTVDLLEGMPVRQGVPEGEGQGPAVDPHVWLDPSLYRRVVDRTERALARARPRDSATFEKGAGTFDRALARLDREYRRGLTGCTRKVIVTSHAAFGYLAKRYGLVQEPISGLSPDAEPDPARLADLAELVRREGVTTIFTEELASPKVADTLAREAGVTTKVLNPLEGLTPEEAAAGEDYVSVMRANLKTLEQALGCPSA